jgi:hypothetical protein
MTLAICHCRFVFYDLIVKQQLGNGAIRNPRRQCSNNFQNHRILEVQYKLSIFHYLL